LNATATIKLKGEKQTLPGQGCDCPNDLEEKAALCTGATAWSTTPIERLGVPEMYVTDGPHGVRRAAEANTLISQSLPATCFPTASCLASSWDVDLLHQMGRRWAKSACLEGGCAARPW
jgi:beta-glucosidase